MLPELIDMYTSRRTEKTTTTSNASIGESVESQILH